MKRVLSFAVVAVGLASPALAGAASYDLDPAHTSVTFSVRHMLVTDVRGEFRKVAGTIEYDEKNPTETVIRVAIDPASIDTREEKRNAHLKSKDFFAVEEFPALTFESKKVAVAGKGKLKVIGDLTMRGVTREVVLMVDGPTGEVTDPYGNVKIGATATAVVNRQDFGISWNVKLDRGGVLVSDEVKITIGVQGTKRAIGGNG